MHGRTIALLSLATGATATPAAAEVGVYVGIAYSDVELEIANAIQSFSVQGSEGAARFSGGLLVGEHFAVEGSFVDVSGYGAGFSYQIPGSITVNAIFEGDYQLMAARAIGKYSAGKFDLFAGVGAYDANFDGNAEYHIFTTGGGTRVAHVSRGENGLTGIAGIDYRLGRAAGVRLDFEWFDMEPDMETSIVSLGFTLRFH